MSYSLHIPRPSLTGSTTSTRSGCSSIHSYSESNSHLPAIAGLHTSSSKNLLINNSKNNNNSNNSQNIEYNNKGITTSIEYKNERNLISSSTSSDNDRKNQINNKNKVKKYKNERFNKSMDDRFNYNINNNQINYNEYDIGQIKRGSRSSQGSSDSHNSIGTASSGSLLLTTANLERFVAIHNSNKNYNNTKVNRDAAVTTNKTTDQLLSSTNNLVKSNDNNNKVNIYTIPNNNNNNNNNDDIDVENDNTMLEIDPNLHFIKTKDVDAVSIASSTHFTMVNGVGGPQRKTKKNGICSRGHQLTVLILSMSGFFLIGILLMVYLMEMRAREMPQM